MNDEVRRYTGGCLCGSLRYEAVGEPLFARAGNRPRIAVRNRCSICMSLVFGGEIGKSDSYTLYAGSLDDPSAFHPTIAIFADGRPPWALIPPGFKIFDRMPP